MQLYDAPELADREAAAAKAELARLQLTRSTDLFPAGAESRAELDQRRAERDQAAAMVRQIEARIVQKSIRAPFAGELGVRRINLGQYVNAGDPVATLTALDPLFVNFALPQQELSKLRIGGDVEITSDAWEGKRFSARITTIEPTIDATTRNVMVQAVARNPEGKLRPGMYVVVQVALPAEPALIVPATAIETSASGDSILVVRDIDDGGVGTVNSLAVSVGRRQAAEVVITSGLVAGDLVVVAGQNRVQAGARVRVFPPSIQGGARKQ